MLETMNGSFRPMLPGRGSGPQGSCRVLRLWVVVLVLGLRALDAAAKNWYLDKDAMGNNSGTSWAHAWTNYASVQWGGRGIVAGDTLFLSGGARSKTYGTNDIRWVVNAAGTSEAPITIRVGQDPGHHGRVIFDYDAYGDHGAGLGLQVSQPWIRLDGEYNGESHWEFVNFRNVTNRSTAYAVYGGGAHAIDIRYLTFSNCNQGVRIQNLQPLGCRIEHCAFLQIRGDAAASVLDAAGDPAHLNVFCSNRVELAVNYAVPPGGSGNYNGPDGLQGCSWSRVFDNRFRVDWNTNIFTSDQHPDFLQMNGTNLSVFNNEFVNIGDSAITMGAALSPVIADVLIYNNLFRIEDKVDAYPEFIRVYGRVGAPQTCVLRFRVFNNTFVDNPWATTYYAEWNNTNFTGSIQYKNNLFYNCGDGEYRPLWRIAAWPNYRAGDVVFANNLYHHDSPGKMWVTFLDARYSVGAWLGLVGVETNSKLDRPRFVRYSPMARDNDFHLADNDTRARGAGADLSEFFTTDKDGNPRTGPWDIGAYQQRRAADPATKPGGGTQ